jgi:hypothetical protein
MYKIIMMERIPFFDAWVYTPGLETYETVGKERVCGCYSAKSKRKTMYILFRSEQEVMIFMFFTSFRVSSTRSLSLDLKKKKIIVPP